MVAVQVLTLAGFSAFYLVELSAGSSDDGGRVLMSVVLILLFAVGLAAIARSLLQGVGWARTGTVVWEVLLLPVGWGLVQSGRALVGAAVIVLALVAITGVAMESKVDSESA